MKTHNEEKGFSLIEVLAAVAIIGIITFLALPNIVTLKQDAEIDLAIARAESVNMAVAAYIQANGLPTAISNWSSATNDQRWGFVTPFLAFAPNDIGSFMPSGYGLTMPTSLNPLAKAGLTDPNTDPIPY